LLGRAPCARLRGFLRRLSINQLWCGVASAFQACVAIEIGHRILELGLIAIAVRRQLFGLGLVGTRVDLREQVAGMHGVPFGEVDADDLSLDLAANGDRVIGDDSADAGQIDRHIVLGNHSGDNRHRWQRRLCCRVFDANLSVNAKTPPQARTAISKTVEIMIFRCIGVPRFRRLPFSSWSMTLTFRSSNMARHLARHFLWSVDMGSAPERPSTG
jgi:hypothetical protein